MPMLSPQLTLTTLPANGGVSRMRLHRHWSRRLLDAIKVQPRRSEPGGGWLRDRPIRQVRRRQGAHRIGTIGHAGATMAARVVADKTKVLNEGSHLAIPHIQRGAEG